MWSVKFPSDIITHMEGLGGRPAPPEAIMGL